MVPGVSLPGPRQRMPTSQLTALFHKKDINLEAFFLCQSSTMLFPVPPVAEVKWHHVSPFWSFFFFFLFSSPGLFTLHHQEKLVLPFLCLPTTVVPAFQEHQTCHESPRYHQPPGWVTRHPEHGAGAQPRAVCCHTDRHAGSMPKNITVPPSCPLLPVF